MTEFVVVAMMPMDTAVIKAESEAEALDQYMLPDELVGRDIFMYVATVEEFYQSVIPCDPVDIAE